MGQTRQRAMSAFWGDGKVHRQEIGHAWQPLKGLANGDMAYDFRRLNERMKRWHAFRQRPEEHARLRRGMRRLERLWSIETGVIEGLYTLRYGVTTKLLDQGFVPHLIQKEDTNIDPDRLLAMLRDHETSVELVRGYIYIREGRPLSAHAIRELHACITAHQDTHTAIDSLGQRVERELRKGVFKKYPNNPTRPDGKLHLYCPPEQVDMELENLRRLHAEYRTSPDVHHPMLVAAWLHHRFVQIHPFADGNGRVARALMNWHLMEWDYLPIAVTQDQWIPYIYALEQADEGNLTPFVNFLVRSTREMLHVILEDDVDTVVELFGNAMEPEENGFGDYPGLRR